MKAKILFLDDIFNDSYKELCTPDQLIWDDNWVEALEEMFAESERRIDVAFDLIKSGDITSWRELIEGEKPDIILLDLFWPHEAYIRYGNRRRGADVSLETLSRIRQCYPSLPVVCFTVRPDKELMERAYGAGATFFLEKVSLATSEVQSPLRYILFYLLQKEDMQEHRLAV